MVLAACNRNRYTNLRRTESYNLVAARSAQQNLHDGFPLVEGQLTELIDGANYTDEERTYLQQKLRPICFKIVLDLLSQDPLPTDPKEYLVGWLTRRIAEKNDPEAGKEKGQPAAGPDSPGASVPFATVFPEGGEVSGKGDLGGSPDVISRGNTGGGANSLEPGTGDGAPIRSGGSSEEELSNLLSRLNAAVASAESWPSKLQTQPSLKDDLSTALGEAADAKRRLETLLENLRQPKRNLQKGMDSQVVELTVDVGNLESKLAGLIRRAEETARPSITFTLDTSDLDQSMSALQNISKDAEDVLKALNEKTPEEQHGVLKRGLKMGLSRAAALDARAAGFPAKAAALALEKPIGEREELHRARAALTREVKEAMEEASVEERNLFQLTDDALKILAVLDDGADDSTDPLNKGEKHRDSAASISSFDEVSVKDMLRRRLLDLRLNQKQLATEAQAARDLLVAPGSVDALGGTADKLQQVLNRASAIDGKLEELSDSAQPLLFDSSQEDSLEVSKRRQALGELTTTTSELEDELGVVSGVLGQVMEEAVLKAAQERLHQGLTSLNDAMKGLDTTAEEARVLSASVDSLAETCGRKQPIKASLNEALADARQTLAAVDEATALGEAALQSTDPYAIEDALQTCQSAEGRAQLAEEHLKSVMADAGGTLKRYGLWTPGYSGEEIQTQLQDLIATRAALEELRAESKTLGHQLEMLAETRMLRDRLAKGATSASTLIGKSRPLEATIQDSLARPTDKSESWGPLVQGVAAILDQAVEVKADLTNSLDEARHLLRSSELRTKIEALEALQGSLQDLARKAGDLVPGLDDEDEVALRQELTTLGREASTFDDTIQETLAEAYAVLDDHHPASAIPPTNGPALQSALTNADRTLEKGRQLEHRLTELTDEAKDMVKENENEDVEELEGKLLDLQRQKRRMTNNMEAAEQKLVALRAQAQTNPDAAKLEDDLEDRIAQAQAASRQLDAVAAQLEDTLAEGDHPRASVRSGDVAELQHRLEDTSGDLEAADASLQAALNEASEALVSDKTQPAGSLGEDFEDRVYQLQKTLKRLAPALALVRNLMQSLNQAGAEHLNCAAARQSLLEPVAEMQDKFDFAADTARQAEDLLGSSPSPETDAAMSQMDQPLAEADQDLSDLEEELKTVRPKAESALRAAGLDVQQCLSEVKSPWDPVIKSQEALRATSAEAQALLEKVRLLPVEVGMEDLSAAQAEQASKSLQDLSGLIKRAEKLDDKFNSLIETFQDDAHALIDESDPETQEVLDLLAKAHQELLSTDQRLRAAVDEAKALLASIQNPNSDQLEHAGKDLRRALQRLTDAAQTFTVTHKRGRRILLYLQSIKEPTREENRSLQDLTAQLAPYGDLRAATNLKLEKGKQMLSTLYAPGATPEASSAKAAEVISFTEVIDHLRSLVTQADSHLGEVRTEACFMVTKSLPNNPEDPVLRELHSAILNVKLYRCGLRDVPKDVLALLGELGQAQGMGFGAAATQKGLSRGNTELGHTETLLAEISAAGEDFVTSLRAGPGRTAAETADARLALSLLSETASIALCLEGSLAAAMAVARKALKAASAISALEGDLEDPLLEYLEDGEVADLYEDLQDSHEDLAASSSKLRGNCLRAVRAALVLLQAPPDKAAVAHPLAVALAEALAEAGGAMYETRNRMDEFDRFPDSDKEKASKEAQIQTLERLEGSFQNTLEAVNAAHAKLEALLSKADVLGPGPGFGRGGSGDLAASGGDRAGGGEEEVSQVLERLANTREELGEAVQTAQEWAEHPGLAPETKEDLLTSISEGRSLENKLQLLEAKVLAADPEVKSSLLPGLRGAIDEGRKKELALTEAIQVARSEESSRYGSEAAAKLAAATEALNSGQNRLVNATKTASYTLGAWEDDPFATEHQAEARRLLSRIIAEAGSVDMAAGGLVSKGQQLLLRLDKRRRSSAKPARAVKASSAAESLTEVLELAICLVASSVDGLQKAGRGQELTATGKDEDEDDDETPQAKMREGVLAVTEARSKLRGECMDALQRCAGIACLPVVLSDEKELKDALLKVIKESFLADEAASNAKGSAAVWLDSLAGADLTKPQTEEAAKHVKTLNGHAEELLRLHRQLQLLLEGRGQEEDGKAVVDAATIEEAALVRAESKLKRYTMEAQAWLEALQKNSDDGSDSPEKLELKRRLQGIVDSSETAGDKVKELTNKVKDLSEVENAAAPPVGNATTRRSVFQKQKSVVQDAGEEEEFNLMYEETAKEVDSTEDELRNLVGRAKSMLMLEPGVETWRDSLGDCLVESMQDAKLLETAAQDAQAWRDVLQEMRDVDDKPRLLASIDRNLAAASDLGRRLDLLHAKAESLLANPNDSKALAAEAAGVEEAIEMAGIDVNTTAAEIQALLMEAHCVGQQACQCDEDLVKGELLRRILDLKLQQAKLRALPKEAMEVLATANGGGSFLPASSKKALSSGIAEAGTTERTIAAILDKAQQFAEALKPMEERPASQTQASQHLLSVLGNARAVASLTADNLKRAADEGSAQSLDSMLELDDSLKEDLLASLGGLQQAEGGLRGTTMVAIDTTVGVLTEGPQGPSANDYRKALMDGISEAGNLQARSKDTGVVAKAFAGTLPEGDRELSPSILENFGKVQCSVDSAKDEVLDLKAKLEELIGQRSKLGASEAISGEIRAAAEALGQQAANLANAVREGKDWKSALEANEDLNQGPRRALLQSLASALGDASELDSKLALNTARVVDGLRAIEEEGNVEGAEDLKRNIEALGKDVEAKTTVLRSAIDNADALWKSRNMGLKGSLEDACQQLRATISKLQGLAKSGNAALAPLVADPFPSEATSAAKAALRQTLAEAGGVEQELEGAIASTGGLIQSLGKAGGGTANDRHRAEQLAPLLNSLNGLAGSSVGALQKATDEAKAVEEDEAEDEIKDGVRNSAADLRQAQSRLRGFTVCALRRCASGLVGDASGPAPESDKYAGLQSAVSEADAAQGAANLAAGPAEQLVQTMPTWPESEERQKAKEQDAANASQKAVQALQEVRRVQRKLQTLLDPTYEAPPALELADRLRKASEAQRASKAALGETRREAKVWSELLDAQEAEMVEGPRRGLRSALGDLAKLDRRQDLLDAKLGNSLPYLGSMDGPPTPEDVEEAIQLCEAIDKLTKEQDAAASCLEDWMTQARQTMAKAAGDADQDPLKAQLREKLLDLRLETAQLDDLSKDAMATLAALSSESGVDSLMASAGNAAQRKKALSKGIAEAGNDVAALHEVIEKAEAFVGTMGPVEGRSSKKTKDGQQLCRLLANARVVATLARGNLQQAMEKARQEGPSSALDDEDDYSTKEDLEDGLAEMREEESKLRGFVLEAIQKAVGMILSEAPETKAEAELRLNFEDAIGQAGSAQGKSNNSGAKADDFITNSLPRSASDVDAKTKEAATGHLEALERASSELAAARRRLEELLRAYEADQNDKALAARKILEDGARRLDEASKELSQAIGEAKDLQSSLLEDSDDLVASPTVQAQTLASLEEGLAEGQACESKVPLLRAKCATALQALEREGTASPEQLEEVAEVAREVEKTLNKLKTSLEAAAAVANDRKPHEISPVDALQAKLKELTTAHRALLAIVPDASALLGGWQEDPFSTDSQVAARQALRRAIAEGGAVGDAAGGVIGATNRLLQEGTGSVADFATATDICGSTTKLVEDTIQNLKSSMERANRAAVVGEDWGDEDEETGSEAVNNGKLNRGLAETRVAQSQLRGVTADALRRAADGIIVGKTPSGEQDPLLTTVKDVFALQDDAGATAGRADNFLESSGDWLESADQEANQIQVATGLNDDLTKAREALLGSQKALLAIMDGDAGADGEDAVAKKKSSVVAASTSKRESATTTNSGSERKRGSLTTVTSAVSASARPDLVLQESDLSGPKAEVDDLSEILRLMEEKGVKEACRLLLLNAMAIEETARATAQKAEAFVFQAGEDEDDEASDEEPAVSPEVLEDLKKKSGDINKSADGLREMKKSLDGRFSTVSQDSDRMELAQALKPLVVKGRDLREQEGGLQEVLSAAERAKQAADFGRAALEMGFAAAELRGRTEEADKMLGELNNVDPVEVGPAKGKLDIHKKNMTALLNEAGKYEARLGDLAKEARVVNADLGDASEEKLADLRKTILKALTSADTQANTLRRATNAAERWMQALTDKAPENADREDFRKLATVAQKAILNLNALETLVRSLLQDLEDDANGEEPLKPIEEGLEGFAKALEESIFLDKSDLDSVQSSLLTSTELPKYIEYHRGVARAIQEAGLKGTHLSDDGTDDALEVSRDNMALCAATRSKVEGVIQKANQAIGEMSKEGTTASDRGAILAGLKQGLIELRTGSELLAFGLADTLAQLKQQQVPPNLEHQTSIPAALQPKVVNLNKSKQGPTEEGVKKAPSATSKNKEDLQGLLNRLPGPICKAVCELTFDRSLGAATAYKIELYPQYLQYAKCSADSRSGFAPDRLNLKDIAAFDPLPEAFDLKTKKGRLLSVKPTVADSKRKATQDFDKLLEELAQRLEATRLGGEETPATRTSSRTQQSSPPNSQPTSSSGAPRPEAEVGGGAGAKGKGVAPAAPTDGEAANAAAAVAKKESQEALKNSLARLPTCICKANFDLTINRIATSRHQVELWKSHIKYSKCAADKTAFAPDILKLSDVKGMEPHENGFDLRLDKGRLFAFRRCKESSEVAAGERLFEQLAELLEGYGISA